jgi:O-antigen/teichoic acid export membrane protein
MMFKKKYQFVFIAIIILNLTFIGQNIPTSKASTTNSTVNIALITKNGNVDFEIALGLDEKIKYDIFTNENLDTYLNKNYSCTFLLDFNNISVPIAQSIVSRVQGGMGLFFQPNNPDMNYNLSAFNIIQSILPVNISTEIDGKPVEFEHADNENINTRQQEVDHFLTQRIDFLSMPQLINLSMTTLKINGEAIILSGKDMPIISAGTYGNGSILVLSAPLRTNSNEHFADWPIFTYMIYCCAMSLSGVAEYEEYGEWQGSPIPHDDVKIGVLIVIIAIILATFVGFFYMKKRSKKIPFVLLPLKPNLNSDDIEEEKETIKTEKQELDQEKIEEVKEEEEEKEKVEENPDNENLDNKNHIQLDSKNNPETENRSWDTIGFHKPLAGFSIMFFLSLALLLPLVIIVMYVLPTFILQDPAQFGIMYITGNIFSAVFIAGDFGLAQAFDKFVGENYIKKPKEAIKYIQFFVWFQMLSGLVQTVGIALIGLYLIPNSMQVAFMSWNFLLKAFVQWPGIAYLFTHTLKSMQRTDKEQMVNLIVLILFDVVGIGIFSTLFLAMGKTDPRIGTVIGGAIGITVAEVIKVFGLLIIGGIVLNKTEKQFTLLDCFRVDFDKELVKKTLIFGLKSMLSTVIFLIGNFAVTIIIMLNLPNYTYWGSFLGSATLLLWPITFMIILYENMLPTTAEAYGGDCKKLTQMYVSYGFKYFGVFGILIFAIFAFFVNNFLTAILPPLFKPMGFFIGFYAITKIFMNLVDYSRLFLISIGKVGHYIVFVTVEQVIRVVFLLALINKVDHPEYLLIWGELPGVILKVLLTWIYTNKKTIKIKINLMQSMIAPGIASIVLVLIGFALNPVYLLVIELFNGNALLPTILYSFLVCSGLAMTVYPFLVAFLGGWDDRSLLDLEFAMEHSGPSKPFFKLFLKMTKLGVKKSPLHNRYPIYVEGFEDDIKKLNLLKNQAINK